MNRRRVLCGMLAAPLVVRTQGLLMPVRRVPPLMPGPFDMLAAHHRPVGSGVIFGVPGVHRQAFRFWSAQPSRPLGMGVAA